MRRAGTHAHAEPWAWHPTLQSNFEVPPELGRRIMKRTSTYKVLAAAGAMFAICSSIPSSADEPRDQPSAAAPAKKAPDRAELEKKFSESMSGATLDGYFTETPGDEAKPRPSKYVINSASKIKDDLWLFQA